MVPSPRKRAQPATRPAFNQTWDDADAAFFDPNSLPVSKIPRGWERKQEVKKGGEGKEKKIWRRFNLRSRAENATEEEDGEEEEQDVRSRAVKRRQHMSPKAMEKTSERPNGKKRAYKATRFDRRKSVLPRKRAATVEDSLIHVEETNGNTNDAEDATEGDIDNSMEADISVDQPMESIPTQPVSNDRRSTFTFTVDAKTVDDLPDYESLDGLEDTIRTSEHGPTEDATLTNFFRSPVKRASINCIGSPEKIEYPELPLSDDRETKAEVDTERVSANEEVQHDVKGDSAEGAAVGSVVEDTLEQSETGEHGINEAREETQTMLESPAHSLDIVYPTLPEVATEASTPPCIPEDGNSEREDVEMTGTASDSNAEKIQDDDSFEEELSASSEEELTEASLQLEIQQEYEAALQAKESTPMEAQDEPQIYTAVENESASVSAVAPVQAEELDVEHPEVHQAPISSTDVVETARISDITDGLTLASTPARLPSAEPIPRKLHSPPPPPRVESGPEDATMTLALDDDTAILKDFLTRAAASKEKKATTTTHRRESLQNRRDSDVVRHALASPRKALEDKDPNSPSKYDNELTLDLSPTLTLSMPKDALASPTPDQTGEEGTAEEKSSHGARRSTRAKKSRLPAPAPTAQAQASKIAIRRADGNEVVVLKKSDTQELATLTRTNTRKNKQGAFCVPVRLLKLAVDSASLPPVDDATRELVAGKNVRWDEQLAYYQENPATAADLLAEAESLATPDELGMPDPPSAKAKNRVSKNTTPKVRRARGLGTANGTPGKGLLAPASLLPEAVQEEKEAAPAPAPAQQLPRPKASKIKKMPVASTSTDAAALSSSPASTKLPSLDVAPVGVAPTAQRKSRLAAPKKVVLPQPVSSLPVQGKENAQRSGISDATPKKGIPAPKVVVPPTAGMESGLPRRRGRKY